MTQTIITNSVIQITSITTQFLNNFINEFNTFNKAAINDDSNNNEHFCSDETLINILKNPVGFYDFSTAKTSNLNRINNSFIRKYNSKIMYFLQTKFPDSSIIMSGAFIYPKTGYMGWHTNADTPYLRCYITYSENGDSYFKYRDPYTKEIIISKDNIGWTLRYFKISNKIDELLWHCVYSNTLRISLGYRIINNLRNIL